MAASPTARSCAHPWALSAPMCLVRNVDVAVDVDLDDGSSYVSLIVVDQNGPTDEGEGDDAIVEFTQSDYVRTLAAKLLEAADALDAMGGTT